MGKRNLYLKTTPVDEAVSEYLSALTGKIEKNSETVSVMESLGRITANAIFARCCSPLFNAAGMDGIAVCAKNTKGASDSSPLTLIRGIDYQVVDTGDPIHSPYDAVIMAEDLLEIDEDTVQIIAAVPSWENVRPIGEDIVTGEMLMPGHHKIRPIDIGVLYSGGITDIDVFKRPKIGIIPTGTEIIEPTVEPEDGDIIESNSRMFQAMVKDYGGIPYRYGIVDDDYDKIKSIIKDALIDNDMVIVNAGSSAGTEDFTVHVLRELGQVIVHGVAIKPGKPVILSIVEDKPVIGLPGYPVSAYIGFENFVQPVMSMFTGEGLRTGNKVDAVISKRIISSLKHREYIRVRVGKVGDKLIASPLARGAGAAMSLVRADGFCVIEQNSEGVEAGEVVKVEMYRSMKEISHTAVAIGSHDLILDLISDIMSTKHLDMHLSSTHVGSMGGLMALKRGEAHMAPTHLLNEESGEYNISYIRRLFPDKNMALIKGVHRIQGIIVKKGNPLGIKDISDLKKCRYINRQRGAGTRVLFDYELRRAGIDPEEIDGYDKEAATHMAVAALVKSDSADAGMGILSAAKAMDLDFIFVGEEEYDFAIEVGNLELPEIKAFIDVLKSDGFHKSIKEIGGYSFINSGDILMI